jgi:hypothetical protein
MEKTSDGSFARITRKTASDDDDDEDEKDWGMALNRYEAWAMLSWPFGPQNHRSARGFLTGLLTARRAKKTGPKL